MKKILLFAAVLGTLASCNKKHDCVCTTETTITEGKITEVDKNEGSSVTYHDQSEDCKGLNETETQSYTYPKYDDETEKTTDVTRTTVDVTTCKED